MSSPDKLITLDNMETYTTFVERKSRSLTLEQYNALSTAEKNNGTTYYITDADAAPSIISNLMFSLTTTLTAGQTSVTFTDNRITSTSRILMLNQIGEDVVPPISETSGTHSITLTYEPQETNMTVCIVVFNV